MLSRHEIEIAKRALALKAGAVEIDRKAVARLIQQKREALA